jgi:hypothetical protein
MNLRKLQYAVILGLLMGVTRFSARETDRLLCYLASRMFPRANRPTPFNGWGRRRP